MIRSILLFFLSLPLFFFSIRGSAQNEIPELAGRRVHDEANVLSRQTIDQLEQVLKTFEDSTTNQVAVLIISSLNGEVFETYSLKVVEKWKLGTKKNDNGALLIVSINDRKMRIEVGQGLEGPLPDAICNRIIRNQMAPRFRQGDYDGGVQAAVVGIMQAIRGEYKSEDPPNRRKGGGHAWLTLLVVILIIIFRAMASRKGGGGSRWSSGGGWFIGGGGGGWSSGGGGGFSGGGGSFGGGGSSGSW